MWSWFKAIDRLLRGELTRLPVLSASCSAGSTACAWVSLH